MESTSSKNVTTTADPSDKTIDARRGLRIPFLAIIVAIVILCSVAITATLLSLAKVMTKSSNDMSIQQGIDSVFKMANEVQNRVSALVAQSVAGVTVPSIKVLIDDVNLYNIGFLNLTNYDTLWRQFYYQSFDPSISLVYYGADDTGDMIGSGRSSSLKNATYLSGCPQNMTAPGGWRIHFNVDNAGGLSTWIRNSSYLTKTRYWFTQGRDMSAAGIKVPQWTQIYVNKNEVGISAVVPFNDKITNTFKGVLAVDITFATLVTSLGSFPITANGFVMIFNSDGIYFGSNLASEKPSETFTNTTTNVTSTVFKPIQHINDTTLNLVGKTVLDYCGGNLTTLPTQMTYTVNGLIFQHLVYKDDYGLNIIIVNGAPLTDYTGDIETTKAKLVLKLDQNWNSMLYISIGLILFFTFAFVIFITFSAVRPLTQLTNQVHKLSMGDFENLQSYANSKNLSVITELRILQASYWNMTVKFAEELKNSMKLTGLRSRQNSRSVNSAVLKQEIRTATL
ncbi:hypothetical protein HDU97_001880 [Phlyctochytrium planicorne]|nr:hypothetical protein HDU97_001880 [Phlyctochytrium planicorne]